jgi:uncharacterized protein YdeI (YjbR/CyaY-like superfamily)
MSLNGHLMEHTDKRIDAYIAQSAPFAQAILQHLRALIHKAVPQVTETIKWGMPFFEYEGPLCNMAAFKQHCAFGFWKASLMKDPQGLLQQMEKSAMGHLGRIRSLEDLPADKVLLAYIKEAAALNKQGVKAAPKAPKVQEELEVPDDLKKALARNKAAAKTFQDFSYSNKKEYLEWITEAKTEDTRIKRLHTAIEWMAEGKPRNWKYMKK